MREQVSTKWTRDNKQNEFGVSLTCIEQINKSKHALLAQTSSFKGRGHVLPKNKTWLKRRFAVCLKCFADNFDGTFGVYAPTAATEVWLGRC